MNGFVQRTLESAFGTPAGLLGRVGGALMARGNAATELQIVRLSRPAPEESALVIGPGPGVGLRAVGERSAVAVGVEPSALMRADAARRCADLVTAGRVVVREGDAGSTGATDGSTDLVISVNNVQLWPDRATGLAEFMRVLRPGGRVLISTHARWLPGGRADLAADLRNAGFVDVQSWAWQPPGWTATLAFQFRAVRP